MLPAALHDALAVAALVAVLLAWRLLPKYLEAKVTEAARGAVDAQVGKVLAEHAHELDKRLEEFRKDLALQQDRYSRDYALFAGRRNEVYAETYGLLEKARGLFAPHLSTITVRPDFSITFGADLISFANSDPDIGPAERETLLDYLKGEGELEQARKFAAETYEKASIRRAQAAFRDFKNACVLNALYYSPPVDGDLTRAVTCLASVAAWAVDTDRLDRVRLETRTAKLAELDGIAADIRRTMRAEMQAGFSQEGGT